MQSKYSKMPEIAKSITRAGSIGIFCHTSPDGDTLASALALYSALTKKGKDVCVICDGNVPEKYRSLKYSDIISLPHKKVCDLSLAIDCSDIDRLGGGIKMFLSGKATAAIDHHKSHAVFADISYVEPDAAACAELIYKLMDSMNLIDTEAAELLFAGIVADTGCFQYSSTTKQTHEIACKLMAYPFNTGEVIYAVHKRITPNVFTLKNRVLSRCKFFADGKVALINFRKEDFDITHTDSSDTEGIITSIIDIDGVEIAFSLTEAAEKSFKISVRTKDYVDASDLAREFGGGGHTRAAGCRLNGHYEDIVDKLMKVANDRL